MSIELPTIEELHCDLEVLKTGFEEANQKITVSRGDKAHQLEALFRGKLSSLFSNDFFTIRFEELLKGIKYMDFNSTVELKENYRGLDRLYWVSSKNGSAQERKVFDEVFGQGVRWEMRGMSSSEVALKGLQFCEITEDVLMRVAKEDHPFMMHSTIADVVGIIKELVADLKCFQGKVSV